MAGYPLLFFVVFFLATCIALLVALMAWQRHSVPGATPLTWLMLAVAWWSFISAVEVMATDLSTKIFWWQMEYLGIATVPVLWFIFALEYADERRWLTPVARWILWIIPVLTILAAATNNLYHGIWADVTMGPDGFAIYNRGSWYGVNVVYSYLLILSGAFLVIRKALQLPRNYRRQIVTLLSGISIPLIINVLYVFGSGLIPHLDLTTLGFAVGGLLIAWSILGFHLLDLGPRARDLLFDSIDEAVLVLDLQDRIVDINPAALRMLKTPAAPIGRPALEVLSAWQDQLTPYFYLSQAEFDLTLLMPDQRLHHFETRISPLYDRHGQLNGHVITARDATDRYEAEVRMRQLQRAVEQSPTSVVITDTNGHIVYVNPKFTRLTGYTLAEALGQNPNILKTGHTPPEEYARLWQTISAGREWHGEFLNRKKNGDTYWEEAHIGPVLDADGHIAYYVAVKEDSTERKRIEEDLRTSRARLKAIFDNASVGITLIDQTGYYVQANQRWAEMIGYSVEELFRLTPSDLTHPDDRAAEEELRWSLLEGRLDSFALEKRYVRKNGSVFWGRLSVTSIRNPAGRVEASLGIISDITQRKEVEETLRRHADQLLLLTQISMNINQSPDLENVLTSAMDGLLHVLNFDQVSVGLLDETRQNLRLWAYHHVPTNPQHVGLVIPIEPDSSLQYLLETKAPLAIEDAQHDPRLAHIHDLIIQQHVQSILLVPLLVNGEVIGSIGCDVLAAARCFTTEEIELAQTVANLLAIRIEQTRLLEDERRLRLQTQRRAAELRGVIDSSRDGIFMISMESQVSVINAPALHLLNLPGEPTTWRGASVRDFIPALRHAARPAAHVALAELRRVSDEDDRPNEGDLDLLTRSLHWQNLPVRAGGTLMGWLFVLHDLTEERAVAQMREDMTRTMVHDLRSPLSSILGSLEMLLDGTVGELEPDQTQTVNIARRSTERMLHLVNAILDVSQLESGHMPVSIIPLQLHDLVQDAFQTYAAQAQSKQIQLLDQLPPGLSHVKADFNLIQRVLQNLVGNAIKFTPPGGQVTISAVRHDEHIMQISVQDTGAGIPPEIRAQLFQKFVTGQQKERGSGLGLAFCKLALEAHGQRIWVDSPPGQGAIFTFTLSTAA